MSLATHVRVHSTGKDGQPLYDENGNPVVGLAINPAKPFVRSYWIPGANPTLGNSIALGALGSGVLEFEIDDQGHFDWKYLVGSSTGAFVLKLLDVGKNRELQNRPVHSSLIVGSAQRPFILPENYFFNVGDGKRVMRCTVLDISGAPNTVRLALVGRRFYHKDADPDVAMEMRKVFGFGEKTYSYFLVPEEYDSNGNPPVIPGGGSTTFSIFSDAGADTELKKLMAVSTGAFSLKLFDRAKNKFLMNDAVVASEVFGNAEFPFIFPESHLLERNKYLLVNITDLSGAPNTIFIAAAGRRLQFIP